MVSVRMIVPTRSQEDRPRCHRPMRDVAQRRQMVGRQLHHATMCDLTHRGKAFSTHATAMRPAIPATYSANNTNALQLEPAPHVHASE